MTDQNWNITVKYILVHVYRVTSVSRSKVYHMFLIFTVMADDLSCMPEFIEQLFTKNRFCIRLFTSWMQTIGNDEKDIFLLNACRI